MSKYIYDRFEFSEAYKHELIEFIRHNTNAEMGGYRIFDGSRTHLLQNPVEISDFIFALKRHEQKAGLKLESFLEIGFSAGINNTILNKFFEFSRIVAVDTFGGEVNGSALKGNLMNKPLTLVCGDSTSKNVIEIVGRLGRYDLIFIDGNHNYEYVKKDFDNYRRFLNNNGVIALHDLANPEWPGIDKLWNEIKTSNDYHCQEFICKDYLLQYGIGMATCKV